MSDAFEQAKQSFLAGVADFEAGRYAEAEAHFEASLSAAPGRVSVLVNLAATRLKLGRPDAALPLLEQALAAEPAAADAWQHRGVALGLLGRHADALAAYERALALAPGSAEAWLRHGQTLQHLERHDAALVSYDRALAIDPKLAQAWSNRGGILKDAGRGAEAIHAFRQALAAGGDAELNGYFLAALTGEGAPDAPPAQYVERLFDDYAASFSTHVVGTLGYRAHRVLVDLLPRAAAGRWRRALDLGCGTGLCGPLLAPLADRIDGVDLSAPMLAQARALGVYDRLEHAELVQHLRHTEPRDYDLVVAADVFIYVGALEAVFGGVQRVLAAAGVFAFSVEEADTADGFELRPSLRYAHSQQYLQALAERFGFAVERVERQPIREDQRRPIGGLYLVLRRG